MSPEIRRVVIFGVLAILLGGYAYVTTPEKKNIGEGDSKSETHPALEFSVDKVKQFEVAFERRRLVCRRTPQGWIEASSGAPLRQDAIDDFLTNLRKLVNLGAVDVKTEELSEFGLKPPAGRIAVEVEGEGTRILSLGKNNPVQTSIYAQINENPQVVLVGSVITWDMRKLFIATGRAG